MKERFPPYKLRLTESLYRKTGTDTICLVFMGLSVDK